MSKKTAPKKKPVNVRDIHPKTLKGLNLMGQARHDVLVGFMREVLKRLTDIETFQATQTWEAMHGTDDSAIESRSAPAEEWPKVGDYVVLTDPKHPQVGRIDERGEFMGGRYGVTWIDGDKSGEEADEMRPATSAEVASHKAKEERAKELAKPLTMGTPVRYGQREGLYLWNDALAAYRLALKPTSEYSAQIVVVKRDQFQIID